MKFNVKYKLVSEDDSDIFFLSLDYHKLILSLLKGAIKNYDSDLYEELYSDNVIKEYTFSTFFRDASFTKEGIILKNNIIGVDYSFDDLILGTKVFGAIQSNLHKQLNGKLMGYNVFVDSIKVLRTKQIKGNMVLVNTKSDILVRDIETNEDGSINSVYLDSNNPKFLVVLKESIRRKMVALGHTDLATYANELDIVLGKNKLKSNVITLYSRKVPSNSGQFALIGNPKLLDYLSNAGIGAQTGLGFGDIKVVKEVRGN